MNLIIHNSEYLTTSIYDYVNVHFLKTLKTFTLAFSNNRFKNNKIKISHYTLENNINLDVDFEEAKELYINKIKDFNIHLRSDVPIDLMLLVGGLFTLISLRMRNLELW